MGRVCWMSCPFSLLARGLTGGFAKATPTILHNLEVAGGPREGIFDEVRVSLYNQKAKVVDFSKFGRVATNAVLEGTNERVSVDLYCDIPLGLNVIHGENVLLVGELDILFSTAPQMVTQIVRSKESSNLLVFHAPGSADGEESLPLPSPGGQIRKWPNLKVFSFEELKSATKNFRSDTLVGGGDFGTVYKGWLDGKTLAPARAGSGMVVAIKKLNRKACKGFKSGRSL
ncbi:serine/threonine-protein kinase Cx32 [Spatholobus suberectus]|nr:serine/threonine-protein kinase Cx32 [Spatholobus suberectus]